jgi:multisubunit Na+/H+ antiporter MnhB subunit
MTPKMAKMILFVCVAMTIIAYYCAFQTTGVEKFSPLAFMILSLCGLGSTIAGVKILG